MTIAPKVFGEEYLVLLSEEFIYFFLVKYFYLKFAGKWGRHPNPNLSVRLVTKVRYSGGSLFMKMKIGIRALYFKKEKGEVKLDTRHLTFDYQVATDFNDLCVFETTILGKKENMWVSFPKMIRFGVGVMYVKLEVMSDSLEELYDLSNNGLNYNKDGALCFNYSRSKRGDTKGIITANGKGTIRRYTLENFKNTIFFKMVEWWKFKEHNFSSICEMDGGKSAVLGTKTGDVLFIDLSEKKIVRKESIGNVAVHSIIEDYRPEGRSGVWAVGPTSDTLKFFQLEASECELLYIQEDAYFNRNTRQRMEITEQEIFENIEKYQKRIQKKEKKLTEFKKQER